MLKNINYVILFVCSIFLLIVSYLNSDSLMQFNKIYFQKTEYKRLINVNNNNDNNNRELNFAQKYEFLKECKINYTSQENDGYKFDSRIIRGVIVYYPIEHHVNYESEFKWFYQSWIEMLKYEPTKWRTDLLLFINPDITVNIEKFFNSYNCSFANKRVENTDMPMCRLIAYVPINNRNFDEKHKKIDDNYVHMFLKDIDLFDDMDEKINYLKYNLKNGLSKYPYIDSILIAFESYAELNKIYNFLIRSDLDVFLTPLFAYWSPSNCNDFNVGRGGYSDTFNMKRLSRIAKNLNLEYANVLNLGSTWYSTPSQFRLVAYLTLFSMLYISNEEFSPPEKENKVFLWPYWHWGVVLLYGQHLAMNHLIATKQINIVNLSNMIDVPTDSKISVFNALHLHVFHGNELFSKFQFKKGVYDNYGIPKLNDSKAYALRIALESKIMSIEDKHEIFMENIKNKT